MLAALLALPASAEPDTGRGAFQAVEAVSDGVYGVLRRGIFKALLPRRLSSQMAEPPKTDSYSDFRARVARIDRRRLEAGEGPDAVTDALVSTLVDRYRLEAFGQASGAYALDRRNWEPRFLASASVLGSAYLWAAGVDAGFKAGPCKVSLKLAPGWRWRMASGGSAQRLAELELSRRF